MADLNPLADSGIRDNYLRGTVGDFLRSIIHQGSTLSIVSAYFTIYAFQALQEQLLGIEHLRFLFGEPRFIRSLDPDRTDTKSFIIDDQGLQLRNRLQQKCVARDCARWIAERVEIKSVTRANLLHGKMYHVAHNGVHEAIIGSSNFTVRGLGLGSSGNNIELNLVVDGNRDRRDLLAWFDHLWNNDQLVADVKQDVLLYLEQLYRNHAPEFVYYKTLFHLFRHYLDEQLQGDSLRDKIQIADTAIWKALYEFQKDGVKGAINKILAHNGCILADSVGLGKTFEALAVIRFFELRNDKVLVLCPKKLRENWTVYQGHNNSELNPFIEDRFGYTVLSHTDLSREGGRSGDTDLATINWGNYDLLVIDESHNFRNDTRGTVDKQGNKRKSRYERLIEDIIRSGVKTKVLLLSATPVNNDLKDLRNQLYLITEGRDEAFQAMLGIRSIRETLRAAQQTFTEWTKKPERRTSELLEKLNSAFFTLLDGLTIARSRKHVERYYKESVSQLGGFPVRLKPLSIYPQIDLHGRFMSYDRLNTEISAYQLSLFSPSKYVYDDYHALYERRAIVNFSQKDRENYLTGMMKVNFLKRLESSVHSFAITMKRTVAKIDDLQRRIQRFKQYRAENPQLDPNDLLPDDEDDEELQQALQVGEKLVFRMAHLDVDRWLVDLRADREKLDRLYALAREITPARDAKLAELTTLIAHKVQHPTTDKLGRPNRKVLVFTAFADTAVYLYQELKDWARRELHIEVAMVSGGAVENRTTFGVNEFNRILTNFSPVSKHRDKMVSMPQDREIDLLIATDCISEGQNLQDCDYLINYDIHWNPVRVIQRFGRIDRIGSINHAVQLVNFWPTQDLDHYIALKNRVEARMALVDIAATQEDNLLNPEELTDLVTDDLKYRDKQLLRLREEVLDLEDLNENVTLNQFTLDDFRLDLMRYLESNRQALQEAPLGLYAVVPADSEPPALTPGVIYCLQQKGPTAGNEVINPLQPFFLVYVARDDGLVRYGFAHPKQILELFRKACSGVTVPYEDLCNLFDQQTCNGADMSAYDHLLQQAVASIASTYKRRAIGALLAGRSGVLPDRAQQVGAATDFELITWLVIMP